MYIIINNNYINSSTKEIYRRHKEIYSCFPKGYYVFGRTINIIII